MTFQLNFLDLLVFTTILLSSSSSSSPSRFYVMAAEAEDKPTKAGTEAASVNEAKLTRVNLEGGDVIPGGLLNVPYGDAPSEESGVLKRDGAVLRESGATKRDGAIIKESGARKRDGVLFEKREGVLAGNDSDISGSATTPLVTAATEVALTVTLASNGTIPEGLGDDALQNRGMIFRMTYVLCGFSALILLYFIVKAVQLRRAKSRSRRYGVLSEGLDSALVEDDESDEEVEVFEVNGSNLRGGRPARSGNASAARLLP